MTLAMGIVVGYVIRLAVKSPEVSWLKGRPDGNLKEVWNDYRETPFKMITTSEAGRTTQVPDYKS